jgi:hypothetical protein
VSLLPARESATGEVLSGVRSPCSADLHEVSQRAARRRKILLGVWGGGRLTGNRRGALRFARVLHAQAPRREDPHLQERPRRGAQAGHAVKTALADALGFYVYASNAWNARLTKSISNHEALGVNPLFEKCEPLKREVESFNRSVPSGGLSPALNRGISVSSAGVEPLFICANERVTTAERLLRGQ